MANAIKVYKYTDQGAPSLVGAAGSGVSMLRQVLVAGLSGANFMITSITRVGTLATATVTSTANLFSGMLASVTGASDALYNIVNTAITVASATTFTYTMAGTPAASPAVGTLMLAPKFGLSSITRSGTTATATLTYANSTLMTNEWMTVVGANETEYNGEVQITVLSGTQFTYQVAGSPATPATGTLTYYKSPAGWSEAFTGTWKSAFRGGATNNSARFYLRVDDGNTVGTAGAAREMLTRSYVAMSDIDTGTEPYPTVAQMANGDCWFKSADATTPRPWTIIADDRYFYLWIGTGTTVYTSAATTNNLLGFGWFPSDKPADAYNCLLAGNTQFGQAGSGSTVQGLLGQGNATLLPDVGGCYLPRSWSQLGGPVGWSAFAFCATNLSPISACIGNMVPIAYPNGPNNGLQVVPVMLEENGFRGQLPGAWCPFHNAVPFNHMDLVDGVAQLPGVTLLYLNGQTGGVVNQLLVDITGPWA